MCGLYGHFGREPLSEGDIRHADRLTDLLAHRGPDRRGAFATPRCVLGFRRLSIIDLDSRADQPFISSDGRHVLVFNGEIYNYKDIRQCLERKGFRHTTTSDTEVLLNSYRCWGDQCLERFEGMFAFAIYDTVEQQLFAARDHIGQKPFYFAMTPRGFIFASELRVLLEHPAVEPRLSIPNVQKYLLYDFFPWDTTPLDRVFKLPPATALTCDRHLNLRTTRYWDSVPGNGVAAPDLDGQVESMLVSSVQKHLFADVPVGVFLSGGLDSSLIASLAFRLDGREPLETFTVAVRANGFDESPVAQQMAVALGSRHHVFSLDDREASNTVCQLFESMDEPLADPGVVPSYFLARRARQHVKVALAGDGGDEIAAGYVAFLGAVIDGVMSSIPRPLIMALRKVVARYPASDRYMNLGYLANNFWKGYSGPSLCRSQLWIAPVEPATARSLIALDWQIRTLSIDAGESCSVFEDLLRVGEPVRHEPLGNQMLYLFQKLFLPEFVCAHTDRMSMQSGLEVRAPFIHKPLIELFNAQPFCAKWRGLRGKLPLRRLGAKLLPEAVIRHPKHGFTFPVSAWLRSALYPYVERLLSRERLATQGLWNVEQVRRLVDEHRVGRANHQRPLWALMAFQQWLANYPRVSL